VALANAPSKAVADQCPVVKTRKRNRRRVLTWFASRWATISRSELKSLTRNSTLQEVGRPCHEAGDSVCRGEWRREAGSHRKVSAKCRRGKESLANSHPPICPCATARLGRDILFFGNTLSAPSLVSTKNRVMGGADFRIRVKPAGGSRRRLGGPAGATSARGEAEILSR